MANAFEIARVFQPLIVLAISFSVLILVFKKYILIKKQFAQNPSPTLKIQKSTIFYLMMYFITAATVVALFSIVYYLGIAVDSTMAGSVLDSIAVIVTIALAIPMFGMLGTMKNKGKLYLIPLIYVIISAIGIAAVTENHVGKDYEHGLERHSVASGLETGIIAFCIVFAVVMLMTYFKYDSKVVKTKSLFWALGALTKAVGFILLAIGYENAQIIPHTLGWAFFALTVLLFYQAIAYTPKNE